VSALSNYLENALMDHLYNNSQHTSLASVYVALFTSDPAEDASGTEVSGTDYARVQVAAAAWNSASNGVVTNNGAITFPEAGSGGWGTVTHVAIFDAASGGNMYHYGALSSSVAIDQYDVLQFADTALSLSLA
jgi:hypothetical protein